MKHLTEFVCCYLLPLMVKYRYLQCLQVQHSYFRKGKKIMRTVKLGYDAWILLEVPFGTLFLFKKIAIGKTLYVKSFFLHKV